MKSPVGPVRFHKGRDAAGLLVFISLTGLLLLYFVHRHRVAGIILFGAGALASHLVYVIWVP